MVTSSGFPQLQDRDVVHRPAPVSPSRMSLLAGWLHGTDLAADALQRQLQGIGKRRLGNDVELDAEVDHRLGDLRTDAADHAVGAHQPGGGDRLEQMLGHQGVDGRHAGDVDDGDLGALVDDRWSRFSMTTWVRSLSSVPISGSARMPSQSLTTGVDSSASSRCWRWMTSSRLFWKTSMV